MSTRDRHYFCRTIHGLEALVRQEISSQHEAKLLSTSHRLVEFTAASDPAALLTLRSPDDIFVFAGKLYAISHTRDTLKVIHSQVAELDFASAIEVCRAVRDIPPQFRYSVTASFNAKRNFNRWEIAEHVRNALHERYPWNYVESRDQESDSADLHIRLHLYDEEGIVGVRLAKKPLYKRAYKVVHTPGSLTPQVAYVMASLMGSAYGRVLLDPVCGVGTIPIEGAALGYKAVLGSDISLDKLHGAKKNSLGSDAHVHFLQAQFARLPYQDSSIDAIVSDLPWGRQSNFDSPAPVNNTLNFLCELVRVSRPKASWVLMSEDTASLKNCVAKLPLKLEREYQLSLSGKHPTIMVLAVTK